MNLFCFSLEGSMDSLYEPIPEHQAKQGSASGRTGSPASPTGDRGQGHHCHFKEVSNFENEKPKKRRSFRRFTSENKIFEGKTVNDTIWQEPSKTENDSHIRRPCQLKDLNEDGFLLSTNTHEHQEDNVRGISYQAIKSGGDPVESMGTLKRLQKLVWTKKARVQSPDEVKRTLINLQDEDDSMISCMKLSRSQEKKANNVSTRRKKELEIRLASSHSASGGRPSTSNGCNLEDLLSHYEGDIQMWNSWKPFSENPFWTCVDFQIAQAGSWGNCAACARHSRLKASHTDMDLLHSWKVEYVSVASSIGRRIFESQSEETQDARIFSSLRRDLMDLWHSERFGKKSEVPAQSPAKGT